jgi:hypothetical protein
VSCLTDLTVNHATGGTSSTATAVAQHVVAALAYEDRKAEYDRRLAEVTKLLTRQGFAVTRAVYTVEQVTEAAAATRDARGEPQSVANASVRSATSIGALPQIARTPRPPSQAQPPTQASGSRAAGALTSMTGRMSTRRGDDVSHRVRVRSNCRASLPIKRHTRRGGAPPQQHKSCLLLVALPQFHLCKLQNVFRASGLSRTIHWSDELDNADVGSALIATMASTMKDASVTSPSRTFSRSKPSSGGGSGGVAGGTGGLTADTAAARFTEQYLRETVGAVLAKFDMTVVPHYGLGAPPEAGSAAAVASPSSASASPALPALNTSGTAPASGTFEGNTSRGVREPPSRKLSGASGKR